MARTRRHTSLPGAGSGVRAANRAGETTYLVEVLGLGHPIRVTGTRDERVRAVADRQRGRISRDQMRAAGLNDDAIDRRARTGSLIRVHRAVYAVGHTAPVPLAGETAALLACGPHAVLSHQTAARLLGLIDDQSIHVLIRGRHGARPDGVHVHRTNRLTRGEVRIVDGLPTTSPARTLCDIAADTDLRTLERAIEEALIQKLVTRRQLETVAAASRGNHGAPRLAGILAQQREPRITRSVAERRMRELIRLAQLPEPLTNARVHGFEADFYWPALGVVVEVQSHRFHLTKGALERDTRKAAKLTAAGLTVSYVTWVQMEREPFAVVARTAQLLARAGTPPR